MLKYTTYNINSHKIMENKRFYQINTNENSWINVRHIKPSRYNIPGMKDALNHLMANYHDNYVVCMKYRQGGYAIWNNRNRKNMGK